MFYGAKAFNQKIGSWILTMLQAIGKFFNASNFNQYIEIGNWESYQYDIHV